MLDTLGKEQIKNDVKSCLTSNGYEIDIDDITIGLDEFSSIKVFAKAIFNSFEFNFTMLLTDNELVCSENDNIFFDMTPYKKNMSKENELIEQLRTERNNRTPLEEINSMVESTNRLIESLEDSSLEVSVDTIKSSIIEIEDYAKEHSISAYNKITNKENYI